MSRHDDRIDDEIAFHLEQQIAKHVAAGMTPEAARRAALVKFGGVQGVREAARDHVRFAALRDFARDVRMSWRGLRRAPAFAGAAIVTFGLGLGAAIAMFSVVNSVLLRPLPYPGADRIVRLFQLNQQGTRNNVAGPNFGDWRDGTHSFTAMSVFSNWGRQPVTGLGEPQMASIARVSARYFEALGVRPRAGRAFAADEYASSQPRVALASAAFADRMGAGDGLLGRQLTFDGASITIVGVMPRGVDYPVGTDLWLPLDEAAAVRQSRTAHNYSAIARLADGATLANARADLSGLSRALKARYGDGTWMVDADAVPVLDVMTGRSKASLVMLLGGSVLLLIVATANLSNMLVARGMSRRREFAVQLAMGATRGRLTRQLLAETFAVCGAGAVAGLLLASGAVRAFVAMGPDSVPRLGDISVDWVAAGAAIAAVLVISSALAIITAFGTRTTATPALGHALNDASRGSSGSRRQTRIREALIVTEIALTMVLLSGGGLLVRSLTNVLAIDPGFRTDDALVADLTMTSQGEDGVARRANLQAEIMARLAALPGVERAGFINAFPVGKGAGGANGQFIEMTRVDEFSDFRQIAALGPAITPRLGFASYRLADAGYFKAMGIPLRRGRLMDEGDGPDAPQVAVISESLAAQKWPGQEPIGRYVQFGNMDGDTRGIRIVGIVGDVREATIEQAPPAILYASYRQRPGQGGSFSVVLRGPAPATLASSVRRVIHELSPDTPVDVRSVRASLDDTTGPRRFNAWLIGAFAMAAFVLAAVGVYGLVAFTVAQRTREMGIRMALGAAPGALVRRIIARGVALAAIGAGVGLAVALWAGRLAKDLLFQVTPADPAVLASSAGLMLFVVAMASYMPARRIFRESPARTLRDG